jgi:protoheme ferro-lyase
MRYLRWLALIALSAVLGVFIVEFMTVHPLRMSTFLLLSSVTAFAIALLIALAFRGRRVMPLAIGVAVIFLAAGYVLDTERFLSREDSRPVPELTRAEGEPGDGHTAVIYFTHGEPETYDPVGWINQFNEFDEQDISFIPLVARPFFVYQLRNAYLEVGSSHHRGMHKQMLQSLEDAYRREGDTDTRFYLSFLDDDPRPDAAVIQALNDGASHIVVSEVFLTISNHTAEGEELIEAVDVERYGATLEFTGPLWDSDALSSMFTERVAAHRTQDDPAKVGILLVGHGQPDEWDEEWPTETSQEIGFREGVLDRFADQGLDPKNLSLAWMSFKEPKPAPKVEEFVANGVTEIFFFSAAISADSIHSQYDIPELVHEADVPEDISIVDLGAWNDDPIVIQAIKEKIDALMD